MSNIIKRIHDSDVIGPFFHTVDYCLQKELSDCKSVLDLGCGPSSILKNCRNVEYSVGVESFKPYFELSKKRKIHSKYLLKKIEDLDFTDNRFDAVIMIEVLEHLSKETALNVLKKAEKWAKKKVIVTSPNGFINQKEIDNNPFQKHLSGWDYKIMKKLGFHSQGLAGLKVLRQEVQSHTMGDDLTTSIKYQPKLFWFFIASVSQIFTYFYPTAAFELFSVKKKKNVESHYNEIYNKENFQFNNNWNDYFNESEIYCRLIKMIKTNKKLRILDIGCGRGGLLKLLKKAQSQHEYYGIDISKEITDLNNSNNPELINFIQEDILNTQFSDVYFDIIISTMVIEHTQDKRMIKEIFRILKKNGSLFISSVKKGKNAWYYLKDENGESVLELSHLREYKSLTDFTKIFSKKNAQIIIVKEGKLKYPIIDFITRRIIHYFPIQLTKTGSFNNFISFMRNIKISIKGYFYLECVIQKK